MEVEGREGRERGGGRCGAVRSDIITAAAAASRTVLLLQYRPLRSWLLHLSLSLQRSRMQPKCVRTACGESRSRGPLVPSLPPPMQRPNRAGAGGRKPAGRGGEGGRAEGAKFKLPRDPRAESRTPEQKASCGSSILE